MAQDTVITMEDCRTVDGIWVTALVEGEFTVGIWCDWPTDVIGFYVGADENGPGGHPWTNVSGFVSLSRVANGSPIPAFVPQPMSRSIRPTPNYCLAFDRIAVGKPGETASDRVSGISFDTLSLLPRGILPVDRVDDRRPDDHLARHDRCSGIAAAKPDRQG